MEIYLSIGIGVSVLIALLVIIIARRPGVFHVERSALVHAPASTIFAIINDLHHWHLWSPYDHRDPKMTKTFDGSESGPGATYTWNGNMNVGKGKMTILDSTPSQTIEMELQFIRPCKATNRVTFTLAPAPGGTTVTWSMDGESKFLMKAVGLMMNFDKMCGKDFEVGLANLDRAASEMSSKAVAM